MLSHEKLKQILDYDPENGVFNWRDYPLPSGKARRRFGKTCIGSVAGHYQKNSYLQIRYDGKLYLGHRLAWFYIYAEWPKEIDHVNGDPSDNRISNLRVATRSQQNANTRRRRNNKTGFKGVCKYGDRYSAYIKASGGKSRYLGSYETAQEAHNAYLIAAKEAFGDFARSA